MIKDRYAEGYMDGYEAGKGAGYNEGYAEGYAEGYPHDIVHYNEGKKTSDPSDIINKYLEERTKNDS